MKHLTVDEIIDFVSSTDLNDETIKLSAAVTAHIRSCGKCLKLVRAFQMLYDEFASLNASGDFKKYVIRTIMQEKANKEMAAEIEAAAQELEG